MRSHVSTAAVRAPSTDPGAQTQHVKVEATASVWSGLIFQRVQLLDVRVRKKVLLHSRRVSFTHLHLDLVATVSTAGSLVTFFRSFSTKEWRTHEHPVLQELLRNWNSPLCHKRGHIRHMDAMRVSSIRLSSAQFCSCFPLSLFSSCQTLQGIQQWEHTVACLKAMIS